MNTYWESFIKKYEKEIPVVPIAVLLQAFWYYGRDELDKADIIIKDFLINLSKKLETVE